MQILLLQSNLDSLDKVSFILESGLEAVVLQASSVPAALEVLKTSDNSVDLMIWDSNVGTSQEIEELKSRSSKIPTILTSQSGVTVAGATPSGNTISIVESSAIINQIVDIIKELVSKGRIQPKARNESHVRIKTKLLLSVCPLQGDIYIRLSKSKFVKLFQQGDVFDLQDLEKYTVKKGVEYLFIRLEQCREFAEKYLVELQKQVQIEPVEIEQVAKMNQSVQETVQELTNKMGFTKEVQEITKAQVKLATKSMEKIPSLAEILKKLEANPNDYIASHSTICAYVACGIAHQIQWGSETTYYKLNLASFLHDITLNNQALAEIQTLEELEENKSKFTEKELKEFKDHPNVAAEMAKKMTEIPPDVDTIIRQHHEKPDATGFPRKIGHSYIAPLSCVFIVAHELTRSVIKEGQNFDFDKFLVKAREKYTSSQFKKILVALEQMNKMKVMPGIVANAKK